MIPKNSNPYGLSKRTHVKFIIFHLAFYSFIAFSTDLLTDNESSRVAMVYVCIVFGFISALLTGIIPLVRIYYHEYKVKLSKLMLLREKRRKFREELHKNR